MPKLAIARDVLADYARLDKALQKRVYEVFGKFATATHAGLHLEKLPGARDPRAFSIRLDDHWRGVVMAPEQGGTYLLVRVLAHEEAYRWAKRNRFDVNAATGALEVVDVQAVDGLHTAVSPAAPSEPPLFAGRSDKDFRRLGVDAGLLPLLRRLATEAELEALIGVLPDGQADAVSMLASGYTVDEAWGELVAGRDPGEVDPDDVEAALHRHTSSATVYVPAGQDDWMEVLAQPWATWRVFLHPSQRRLAYREEDGQPPFAGPVRVTGGAGTGKTVVAVHRARALAERAGGEPVLLTTFSRSLAASVRDLLRMLNGPALAENVEVANVDAIAYRVVRDAEGALPRVAADHEQRKLWQDVADELGSPFHPVFLHQEWEQVVLAQGVASLHEYLTVPRAGRGVRLSRRDRAEVWKAVEAFTTRMVTAGKRTHLQLADAAAGFLAARSVKPYRHVIVDEAQDLHAAQWRMLRAAVAEAPADLFIVGDTHQRIYDRRTSLSRHGINVRGRSFRLRLSYRTTSEILRAAQVLLVGERFDDLDGADELRTPLRAQRHGPPPELAGYTTWAQELDALVEAVRAWHAQDVPLDAIGVAARTRQQLTEAAAALDKAGIPATTLGDDPPGAPGVQLATMHRMKGLEYRCLTLIGATASVLPTPAITSPTIDPTAHRHDLQRERCLTYVACTRARDHLRLTWHTDPSPFLAPLWDGPR